MSPYRAFDTLAKALNPGESTACQSSVEGMEGSVHLIAGDPSINYIEKEGPLLSNSHVAFRLTMPSPMPEYLNGHYIGSPPPDCCSYQCTGHFQSLPSRL